MGGVSWVLGYAGLSFQAALCWVGQFSFTEIAFSDCLCVRQSLNFTERRFRLPLGWMVNGCAVHYAVDCCTNRQPENGFCLLGGHLYLFSNLMERQRLVAKWHVKTQ
ncbi:hypothetical protein [Kingella sp. (in: b-proteobacteria)]|uniref:hypothetical protein n=1 Tax=Kingella sp. (in: b-proteobacteria) TaxID=2020713 RepID=UPI0026DB6A4D|nr:hypothetical protein [Kingella sp. (in: b-proteobacteria)]MDO4658565.1 hypothetical protein [Kingella sp. (in: b-proteobacteria)]